jgi:hypothetical protein
MPRLSQIIPDARLHMAWLRVDHIQELTFASSLVPPEEGAGAVRGCRFRTD